MHSSFHGDPDLDAWLRERGIGAIAVCGIQTNFCCETTARIGFDLGYDVWFVLDATHTFDDVDPDGEPVPAAEIARMTAINLQDEFADVVTTAVPRTKPRPMPRYWASPVRYGPAIMVRQAAVIWSAVGVGGGEAVQALPQ